MPTTLRIIEKTLVSLRNDLKQLRAWATGSPTGNLSGLTTTNKSSLVAAINEVRTSGGGTMGPQGSQGAVGPQGATGTASTVPGPQGAIGPQGTSGAQGAIGAQGTAGPQGATGAQGTAGSQGATGVQGPAGFQGANGAQGAVGPQGSQGQIGPQGANGAQGAVGPQGSQGQIGPQGANGAQGAVGPQGAQGSIPLTLLEYPPNIAYEQTDPAVIPFFQTQFVATATSHLVDVDVGARAIGYGTASIWLAWCDQTLGRRPYPKTQTEFLSGVAGIKYVGIGSINPSMESVKLTVPPNGSGIATNTSRKVMLTGLTVGHTYYLDLCAGIQGNGSQSFDTALNLYRCVGVNTVTGKIKLYMAKFVPLGSGVSIVSFDGFRPLGDPVLSATTIPVGASEHAQTVNVIPDQSRVLLGAYSTLTAGTVYVIDTTTDALAYPAVAIGDVPMGFATLLDNSKAWIALNSGAIRPITISTGALGTSVATGGTPQQIAINPAGTLLAVACKTTSDVRFHDAVTGAASGAAVALSAMGTGLTPGPTALTFNNDGTKVYVTDSTTGYLHEIDVATRSVSRTMSIGIRTWAKIAMYGGTKNQTVQMFGSGGTGPQGMRQINITDWVEYTPWSSDGFVDAWIGPRGEIIALDSSLGKVIYWMGCRFVIKNIFPGGGPDFAWGEHAQLLVSPAT